MCSSSVLTSFAEPNVTDKQYRVGVEGDHIKKLTSAKPVQAVAELVWSAVDADATR